MSPEMKNIRPELQMAEFPLFKPLTEVRIGRLLRTPLEYATQKFHRSRGRGGRGLSRHYRGKCGRCEECRGTGLVKGQCKGGILGTPLLLLDKITKTLH